MYKLSNLFYYTTENLNFQLRSVKDKNKNLSSTDSPFCFTPKEIFWIKVMNEYIYILWGEKKNIMDRRQKKIVDHTYTQINLWALNLQTFDLIYDTKLRYFKDFVI